MLIAHPNIILNPQRKRAPVDEIPLMAATILGFENIVNMLLQHPDIDVNAKGEFNETSLIMAIQYDQQPAFELLLSHPDVHVNHEDVLNRTPLLIAVVLQRVDMVRMLLVHPKIDVNKFKEEENSFQSPLAVAIVQPASNASVEIARLLVQHPDMDPNQKVNKFGLTLFMMAVNRNAQAIVQLMIESGKVDFEAKNIYGDTALDFAKKKRLLDMARILESAISE